MTGVIVHSLEDQLILHEGLKLRPYKDTEGFWTVGVGYNLSARGTKTLSHLIGRALPTRLQDVVLTRDEALTVLRHDMARIDATVRVIWPFYTQLSPVRQKVVLDMVFNMGARARGFRNAMAAAEREYWPGVVHELYHSRWAHQVGDGPGNRLDRADRLARMVETNLDYVA